MVSNSKSALHRAFSVFQRLPAQRAAPLNLTVLLGSFIILTLTVILWPVGSMVRRHYQRPLGLVWIGFIGGPIGFNLNY